jgi:ubiquinone/menaquinone biosynthesis C-methylase UbiE
MTWYDSFSRVYDQTVEMVYRGYRREIAQALQLRPGEAVLDLACGTGGIGNISTSPQVLVARPTSD